MPHGPRSVGRPVCSVVGVLRREGADIEGVVLFWDPVREVLDGNFELIGSAVTGDIIGKADLVWLVYVQHVDFVVPRPGVQVCRIGVIVDHARPILGEQADHGRGTRASVHPYRKRCVSWIFPGLEEPEEGVDGVILILVDILERVGRKMHFSPVREQVESSGDKKGEQSPYPAYDLTPGVVSHKPGYRLLV